MRRGRMIKACMLCQKPKRADAGDVDLTLNVDEFVQEDTLDRDKAPPREAIEPLRRELRDAISKASKEIKRHISELLEKQSSYKKLLEQYNLVNRHQA